MNRSEAQARKDMMRVMRLGESILAFGLTKPLENRSLFPVEDDRSWMAITNARIFDLPVNNNGIDNWLWSELEYVTLGKKRFKPTVTWKVARYSWAYGPNTISSEIASAIGALQSGRTTVINFPDEPITAMYAGSPHALIDDETLRSLSQAYGIPEQKIICPICGEWAGEISGRPREPKLYGKCTGCHRRVVGLQE